jgi:metallo-beta-lactamase class B
LALAIAHGIGFCAAKETGDVGPEYEWEWLSDPDQRPRPPFRIFDDLYYVGLDWVAAYLLATSDGLILIDTLYEPFTDHVLQSIRALGFEPADVKFIVVTHGHWDHAGGAALLQERTGARLVMSEADWELVRTSPGKGRRRFEPPAEDLVLRDGDILKLGETTVRFLLTPGHTDGVLSLVLPVHDGKRAYRALTFGGAGLDFDGADRLRAYIDSVRRLLALEDLSVNLPNHPGMGRIFRRAALLQERRPGQPHPFVAPDELRAWLQERLARATDRLEPPLTPDAAGEAARSPTARGPGSW